MLTKNALPLQRNRVIPGNKVGAIHSYLTGMWEIPFDEDMEISDKSRTRLREQMHGEILKIAGMLQIGI